MRQRAGRFWTLGARNALQTGLAVIALGIAGCGKSNDAAPPACGGSETLPACTEAGGANALSTCLSPRQPDAYYVEQGNKYFDTLDTSASPDSVPNYGETVARWEWPPWLKLTAFGRDLIHATDKVVKDASPSTVPTRECRAFAVQPFARCHVSFQYADGPCAIYEEFVFNDQGEVTFIEAWSDIPGMLPTNDPSDRWAEGRQVHRMSSKVPGLGSSTGRIDLDSVAIQNAGCRDEEVADFVKRAKDYWTWWFDEVKLSWKDSFTRGCGW